jgi:hypothetical protein
VKNPPTSLLDEWASAFHRLAHWQRLNAFLFIVRVSSPCPDMKYFSFAFDDFMRSKTLLRNHISYVKERVILVIDNLSCKYKTKIEKINCYLKTPMGRLHPTHVPMGGFCAPFYK